MSAVFRLLQLASPTLPVGGFSYSRGLETAVERGWVVDEAGAQSWIAGLLASSSACSACVVVAMSSTPPSHPVEASAKSALMRTIERVRRVVIVVFIVCS